MTPIRSLQEALFIYDVERGREAPSSAQRLLKNRVNLLREKNDRRYEAVLAAWQKWNTPSSNSLESYEQFKRAVQQAASHKRKAEAASFQKVGDDIWTRSILPTAQHDTICFVSKEFYAWAEKVREADWKKALERWKENAFLPLWLKRLGLYNSSLPAMRKWGRLYTTLSSLVQPTNPSEFRKLLRGTSKFDPRLYEQMAERLQDLSLETSWKALLHEAIRARDPYGVAPLPNASAKEIRLFLNDPANEVLLLDVVLLDSSTCLGFRYVLPEELQKFKNLQFLTFSGCNLYFLPPWFFKAFPRLCQLDLSDNELQQVKIGAGHCPRLKKLKLGDNPLPIFEAKDLPNLTYFDCSNYSPNAPYALTLQTFKVDSAPSLQEIAMPYQAPTFEIPEKEGLPGLRAIVAFHTIKVDGILLRSSKNTRDEQRIAFYF